LAVVSLVYDVLISHRSGMNTSGKRVLRQNTASTTQQLETYVGRPSADILCGRPPDLWLIF